ncbi:hypothetical protein HDU98_000351, partial [Podochytrium sp. JEL0797]
MILDHDGNESDGDMLEPSSIADTPDSREARVRGLGSVLSQIQDVILQPGDAPNKAVRTISKDLLALKKTAFNRVFALLKALIYRVFELFNPSDPFALFGILSVASFVNSRFKDKIPDGFQDPVQRIVDLEKENTCLLEKIEVMRGKRDSIVDRMRKEKARAEAKASRPPPEDSYASSIAKSLIAEHCIGSVLFCNSNILLTGLIGLPWTCSNTDSLHFIASMFSGTTFTKIQRFLGMIGVANQQGETAFYLSRHAHGLDAKILELEKSSIKKANYTFSQYCKGEGWTRIPVTNDTTWQNRRNAAKADSYIMSGVKVDGRYVVIAHKHVVLERSATFKGHDSATILRPGNYKGPSTGMEHVLTKEYVEDLEWRANLGRLEVEWSCDGDSLNNKLLWDCTSIAAIFKDHSHDHRVIEGKLKKPKYQQYSAYIPAIMKHYTRVMYAGKNYWRLKHGLFAEMSIRESLIHEMGTITELDHLNQLTLVAVKHFMNDHSECWAASCIAKKADIPVLSGPTLLQKDPVFIAGFQAMLVYAFKTLVGQGRITACVSSINEAFHSLVLMFTTKHTDLWSTGIMRSRFGVVVNNEGWMPLFSECRAFCGFPLEESDPDWIRHNAIAVAGDKHREYNRSKLEEKALQRQQNVEMRCDEAAAIDGDASWVMYKSSSSTGARSRAIEYHWSPPDFRSMQTCLVCEAFLRVDGTGCCRLCQFYVAQYVKYHPGFSEDVVKRLDGMDVICDIEKHPITEGDMVMCRDVVFGYGSFKQGQLEVLIALIIHGLDLAAIQPCGWGKSLLVQYLAIFHPRDLLIVIEPSIKLMEDQEKECWNVNIPAASWHHRTTATKKTQVVAETGVSMMRALFLSFMMLQHAVLQIVIRNLKREERRVRVIIDEADVILDRDKADIDTFKKIGLLGASQLVLMTATMGFRDAQEIGRLLGVELTPADCHVSTENLYKNVRYSWIREPNFLPEIPKLLGEFPGICVVLCATRSEVETHFKACVATYPRLRCGKAHSDFDGSDTTIQRCHDAELDVAFITGPLLGRGFNCEHFKSVIVSSHPQSPRELVQWLGPSRPLPEDSSASSIAKSLIAKHCIGSVLFCDSNILLTALIGLPWTCSNTDCSSLFSVTSIKKISLELRGFDLILNACCPICKQFTFRRNWDHSNHLTSMPTALHFIASMFSGTTFTKIQRFLGMIGVANQQGETAFYKSRHAHGLDAKILELEKSSIKKANDTFSQYCRGKGWTRIPVTNDTTWQNRRNAAKADSYIMSGVKVNGRYVVIAHKHVVLERSATFKGHDSATILRPGNYKGPSTGMEHVLTKEYVEDLEWRASLGRLEVEWSCDGDSLNNKLLWQCPSIAGIFKDHSHDHRVIEGKLKKPKYQQYSVYIPAIMKHYTRVMYAGKNYWRLKHCLFAEMSIRESLIHEMGTITELDHLNQLTLVAVKHFMNDHSECWAASCIAKKADIPVLSGPTLLQKDPVFIAGFKAMLVYAFKTQVGQGRITACVSSINEAFHTLVLMFTTKHTDLWSTGIMRSRFGVVVNNEGWMSLFSASRAFCGYPLEESDPDWIHHNAIVVAGSKHREYNRSKLEEKALQRQRNVEMRCDEAAAIDGDASWVMYKSSSSTGARSRAIEYHWSPPDFRSMQTCLVCEAFLRVDGTGCCRLCQFYVAQYVKYHPGFSEDDVRRLDGMDVICDIESHPITVEDLVMCRDIVFQYGSFKQGQLEVLIALIIHGLDLAAIQPCGWGKSLLVQYLAIFHPRDLLIVIEPSIKLMEDQEKECWNVNIPAASWHHRTTATKKTQVVAETGVCMMRSLFLSFMMLQHAVLQTVIRNLKREERRVRVIIDEADVILDRDKADIDTFKKIGLLGASQLVLMTATMGFRDAQEIGRLLGVELTPPDCHVSSENLYKNVRYSWIRESTFLPEIPKLLGEFPGICVVLCATRSEVETHFKACVATYPRLRCGKAHSDFDGSDTTIQRCHDAELDVAFITGPLLGRGFNCEHFKSVIVSSHPQSPREL